MAVVQLVVKAVTLKLLTLGLSSWFQSRSPGTCTSFLNLCPLKPLIKSSPASVSQSQFLLLEIKPPN